jgi:signal peptidase
MTGRDAARAKRLLRDVVPLVVLVMVVSPFVVYAVPELVGGDRSYIVLSGSMEPDISTGDVVVVGRVDADAVGVGDVITFSRAGSDVVVTHRVVEVVTSDQGVAFRTKGDANEEADPSVVRPENVVGRVVLTIPYLGHVVMFVGSTAGFALVVALPVGLLILSELWRFATTSEASRGADSPRRSALGEGDSAAPDATAAFEWVDDAAPVDGEAAADEADLDDGIVFTKADLTVSSLALFLLAAYAVWTAYEAQTPLAITLAVAAATTFLLVVGVRQFGLGADSVDPAAATTVVSDGGTSRVAPVDPAGGATVIPSARLTESHRDLPRVEVSSLAGLSDLARRISRPVVRDAGDGSYLVVDGDVVFATAPETARTPTESESVDGETR